MPAKITGYTVITLCQSIAVHTLRKRYVYILQWNPALWPPLTNSCLRYRGHFVVIWTLVYHFRKIVCHIQWIERPGIMLALSFIVLTFLNGKVRKYGLIVLTSLSTHYHTHQEYARTP